MKKAVALIIEDSVHLADYFSEVLQAAGYQTVIAFDGRMAQKKLQKMIPDIILLDLNLPHVSGEELLNFIRSDKRFTDTHVFIASANGTLANQIGEKADLVLQKPIDYDQLMALSRKFHPHYKSNFSSFGQA
jgi:DNA-binding response OmpR family regulator